MNTVKVMLKVMKLRRALFGTLHPFDKPRKEGDADAAGDDSTSRANNSDVAPASSGLNIQEGAA